MNNPTDTNQASKDGIRDLLRIIDIESGDEPDSYWIDESSIEKATAAIQELIRTEKQKLLDALEAKAQEYVVIGEQLRGFPYFITVDNIKAERNKLEAEL